jgi:hypothetical protein
MVARYKLIVPAPPFPPAPPYAFIRQLLPVKNKVSTAVVTLPIKVPLRYPDIDDESYTSTALKMLAVPADPVCILDVNVTPLPCAVPRVSTAKEIALDVVALFAVMPTIPANPPALLPRANIPLLELPAATASMLCTAAHTDNVNREARLSK